MEEDYQILAACYARSGVAYENLLVSLNFTSGKSIGDNIPLEQLVEKFTSQIIVFFDVEQTIKIAALN
ncbi:MAG: hypothetical protein H0T73_14055 [Ardenticatenales bacterium]|nr:hypothetical protein [Ardenticatenales bacterium]